MPKTPLFYCSIAVSEIELTTKLTHSRARAHTVYKEQFISIVLAGIP